MFGCNFECRGFGQGRDQSKWLPKDQMPHVTDPNRLNYKSYHDLPVPKIGCDTSASWSHLYKHIATIEENSVVAKELLNLTPRKNWNDIHLIITGGEPMLWQKQIPDLLSQKAFEGLEHVTIETNATQKFTPAFKEFLDERHGAGIYITWSCSPKLGISGEDWKDAIKPEVVQEYNRVRNSELYLKFVVQDREDIKEVITAQHAYGLNVPVYLMPCGGTVEGLELTEKGVAELALKYGYRFSPRLHVHLFGNAWGT
jgi:organic radical activating enzyme